MELTQTIVRSFAAISSGLSLEHSADVVRQSRRHADELRPSAKQGARTVSVKRLHMHRPIPSRAHDLRQSLRIVLVGLGYVRQRGGIWGVIEVAVDQAAAVEIWIGTVSISGGVRSAIASVCM
jgi:hypothetical protein